MGVGEKKPRVCIINLTGNTQIMEIDMKSTQHDRDIIKDANGLYVGMLHNDEIEALNRCVSDGVAIREYNILGLAKVKYIYGD